MADLDEQSAVVSEEVTPEKKVKRARAAAAATNKKTGGAKTGAKRNKKPVAKGQEVETNPINPAQTVPESPGNHQIATETDTPVAEVKAKPAPVAEKNHEQLSLLNDNSRVPVQAEPAVIAEQQRPEPVYGEGLIEVSGKGFGFLRDPKRNYDQSTQEHFLN